MWCDGALSSLGRIMSAASLFLRHAGIAARRLCCRALLRQGIAERLFCFFRRRARVLYPFDHARLRKARSSTSRARIETAGRATKLCVRVGETCSFIESVSVFDEVGL